MIFYFSIFIFSQTLSENSIAKKMLISLHLRHKVNMSDYTKSSKGNKVSRKNSALKILKFCLMYIYIFSLQDRHCLKISLQKNATSSVLAQKTFHILTFVNARLQVNIWLESFLKEHFVLLHPCVQNTLIEH